MSNNDINPFAALLKNSSATEDPSDSKHKLTATIEKIFGFTLNKNRINRYVYLEDLAGRFPNDELNIEVLEHALFERILLPNPQDYITENNLSEDERCETKIIVYLFNCFKKVQELDDLDKLKSNITELILRNVITALKQPELYADQDLLSQFYAILKTESDAGYFFTQTYKQFLEDEDGAEAIKEPFTKLLNIVHIDVAKASLITFPLVIFDIINLYSTYEHLALILLDYCQPRAAIVGADYAHTLLGALLTISILPKIPDDEYEYFHDSVNQASAENTQAILWSRMDVMSQNIHNVILSLLKCSEGVKIKTLTWLGGCLRANTDRGKLWNAQGPGFNASNAHCVSDGFMLNLGNLMMRLCKPFCSNLDNGKILKVDPTYCAVPNDDCESRGIHLLDMSKETCLVPVEEGEGTESRPTASSYNFVTECFIMGHKAFDLGYRVAAEQIVRLNMEMSRIERAYNDVVGQAGSRSDIVDSIKNRLTIEFSKFLSLKCVMTEPNFLAGLYSFMSASAFWLNQIVMNTDYDKSSPLKYQAVTFPLPNKIAETLKCIPEFIVENIVCYLIYLRRFTPGVFEEQGYERLRPIFTFILVYMGSSQYTRNPHLRARLAEALEALLPFHKNEPTEAIAIEGMQRKRIFIEHEHRSKIVEMLLDVFVGIEMTGQNVQFEQKFNYRRPMYMIMDYLWEIEEYRGYFMELAKEAERNMEAVSPPLFLRFVNLLINDAIFLLDESLANMAKLREMQTAKDRGEWDRLPVHERTQNMAYMQHVGMLAKFDNILGRDTIRTVQCLTSLITIVFTHTTMVDRVAAMLNYFLLNLVGPNQKNFKVKDFRGYNFDPAATVLDICKIYVNLKESEQFCLAVSQDGRSYSPELFHLAEDVLVRIGGGTLVGELQEVASKVSEKAAEYQTKEEAISEAPEHFLDPIMSTLMSDPVILPSSKQTVDRSTIARHLLSDQTDPFNRAPLSMDQVIPNTELANEIRQWLEEREANKEHC